jgi:hypothetical protein
MEEITMCNNCIHQPVCGKFLATGGHVRECRYWMHAERFLEEWNKMKADNEQLQRMLHNAYEIIGKMTDRWG